MRLEVGSTTGGILLLVATGTSSTNFCCLLPSFPSSTIHFVDSTCPRSTGVRTSAVLVTFKIEVMPALS